MYCICKLNVMYFISFRSTRVEFGILSDDRVLKLKGLVEFYVLDKLAMSPNQERDFVEVM